MADRRIVLLLVLVSNDAMATYTTGYSHLGILSDEFIAHDKDKVE